MDTPPMDLKTCQRVLLYGGSFDPPHIAHTRLPVLAMRAIDADAVAYIPTGKNPLKARLDLTPASHRLAMLRLAMADIPQATILTDEIEQADDNEPPTPNYTVETLEALRQRWGDEPELRLLVGGDTLRQFHRWHRPDRVIELATPLVMVRPPDTRASLLDSLPLGADRDAWSARMIDLPLIDISSTRIRHLVAEGRSIQGLVAPAVQRYIDEHRLYRDRSGAP